jgi:CheY-like chemotaxis protein
MQPPPLVLVVEDDVLVREMIVHELRLSGLDVAECVSAEEALARSFDRLDLLFTDIRLPGMSGWQLAEAIRLRHPDLPVIYASGYADRIKPLPGTVYLQKPYLPSQVLQAAAELGIKLPAIPPG